MIVRTLKLRLSKSQEKQLEQWLWNLTGLYNWGLKKIEHDAKNKIFYSLTDINDYLNSQEQEDQVVIRPVIKNILERIEI